MLLSWFIVFLCISANTGDVLLLRKPGENVTLQCSFAECVSSIDGCVGMYLYHGLNPEKEVLYYHYSEKVTPRKRYSQRVEKNGSLGNHTLTISNLVAEDSGLYRCDYKRTTETDVKCTGYILVVSACSSFHTGKNRLPDQKRSISRTSMRNVHLWCGSPLPPVPSAYLPPSSSSC
ncbi:V-set and immunoglobulin domain-containing protein 1 isoform X2 [Pleuronectes platessa]|uniref:V-set and immunoglobulin domain-containing protein 1 isoform X2 n=1 Tax=Pleuronectes platessa TaxID=8262 RepID=UPI00232A3193|nr:V-set and immunoglobulin domain-containing protein 1 isoform X2 [Pleuronectes platessa]